MAMAKLTNAKSLQIGFMFQLASNSGTVDFLLAINPIYCFLKIPMAMMLLMFVNVFCMASILRIPTTQ